MKDLLVKVVRYGWAVIDLVVIIARQGDSVNCGTFQIARMQRVIDELLQTDKEKPCAECGTVLDDLKIAPGGYECPACRSLVCIICGCTPNRQCPGGCEFIGPGFCSSHNAEFERRLAPFLQ